MRVGTWSHEELIECEPTAGEALCLSSLLFDARSKTKGRTRGGRCPNKEPIPNPRLTILTRRVSEGICGIVPRSRFGL